MRFLITFASLGVFVALPAAGVIGPNDPCPMQTPYPPASAGAGMVYNGTMEGGFANGVANQWVAWKDSDFTGQVHFAGTDRAYAGSASQKLNLPQPDSAEASAGLYQRIWVVPGATYTASAWVYIVFPDNLPIDDVYASMGLDNFGQPSGRGSGMTWCCDNGLSAGQEYLVKAWIKWEFRGHQPTGLKFYLGIDQTGQTTDGNAATIDWGEDQVAGKAPVHEIFSHAWRTFTAGGGRVSLWLRASRDVDEDVDSNDMAVFLQCLSGPGNQADPACED